MTRQSLSESRKLSYYYDEAASGGIQVVLKPFTYFPVLANMQRQLHPEGGETKRLRGSDLGRDHKDFAASSRSFCYGGSTQDRHHDARHVDRVATLQKRSSSGGGGGGVGGSQWSNDSRASPRYGSSAVSSNSVPSEGNETKRSTKPLPQYCRRNDALSADMVATTQIRSSTGGGGGGVSGGGAFSAVQTAPVQATKKKRKNRGKNYAGGSDDDDDDNFEDYYPGSHGGGSTGVGGVGGSNSGGGSD